MSGAKAVDCEIWHNPRCSKSRAALAWLETRGLVPQVRRYLETPPDRATLTAMLSALSLPPSGLLRPREGAGLRSQPEAAILEALLADPSLIERPVVRLGARAVIARPAEAIIPLLG
ncbi:MAG: ArsC/Spx/MgsR family protein [Pararhodobacter sp.]